MKRKVVKNSVGVSPPVGCSFESEEDPFVISIWRVSQILTDNIKTVICGQVLYLNCLTYSSYSCGTLPLLFLL